MPFRVLEEPQNDIPVRELKLNEIAIITKWGNNDSIVNRLVTLVRTPDTSIILIVIGDYTAYWTDWKELNPIDTRVRVLPKGTILITE